VDRRKYMSLEEVTRLRASAARWAAEHASRGHRQGPLAWLVVDLALATGLRVSELARITMGDVDYERGLLTVVRSKKREKTGRIVTDPKTGKEKPEYRPRRVPESLPVDPAILEHVRRYVEEDRRPSEFDTLWIGKRGPLTAQGLELLWRKAVIRAGLTTSDGHALYSIHCARHTCGTHLLRETRNLRLVQKWLGHSSPTVTANVYADVSDEEMRAGVTGLYDR
jgi:integrase